MRAAGSARQLISSRGRDAAVDDDSVWERRLFQRIDDHGPLFYGLFGRTDLSRELRNLALSVFSFVTRIALSSLRDMLAW